LKAAFASEVNGGPIPTLVGVISAGLVSWAAIAWLLRFLQQHTTWIFVVYRLLFGFTILIWFRHLGVSAP
jgi:undecaprenyl-diphosphatase